MSYIIHKANWSTDERVYSGSMLVQNGRIQGIQPEYSYYRYMRMNLEPFTLTPTHTMADWNFPVTASNQEKQEYINTQFLQKGCTTVLVFLPIKYEYQLESTLKEARKGLQEIGIDYTLGITCPFEIVTLDFVRKCKRYKIPIIRVQFTSNEQVNEIKWSWIKQALDRYPIVFAPHFNTKNDTISQERKELVWQKTLQKDKIPFIPAPMKAYRPLPIRYLKKIGIYPKRGNFLVGGEISYNLYYPSENTKVEEEPRIHYDNDRLLLTVLREKTVKLFDQTFSDETIGQEIIIKTPAFFV
ncbi:hypothetical protein [Bacillus sp. 2205SS5-2]|uniref:hypothetical protein n=1 Tax=Bacillus sp. 2205SS5-2 TaxID=3109031 RepID=UPI0030051F76